MDMNWPERPLFGGAITCRLSPEWYDASDIRPVPDHQECFCYDDHPNNVSHLWVFEILQRHHEVDDDHIAQYLFHDLALANEAEEASTTPSFQSDVPAMTLADGIVRRGGSGIQRIRPGRADHAAEEAVAIALAVWRLPPEYATDILVSLSTPLLPNRGDGIDVVQQRQEQHQFFQEILSTIQIRDYSLFQG
jgi:Ran-interacting Mog1 protein